MSLKKPGFNTPQNQDEIKLTRLNFFEKNTFFNPGERNVKQTTATLHSERA